MTVRFAEQANDPAKINPLLMTFSIGPVKTVLTMVAFINELPAFDANRGSSKQIKHRMCGMIRHRNPKTPATAAPTTPAYTLKTKGDNIIIVISFEQAPFYTPNY